MRKAQLSHRSKLKACKGWRRYGNLEKAAGEHRMLIRLMLFTNAKGVHSVPPRWSTPNFRLASH